MTKSRSAPDGPALSFFELDAAIQALPEGPVALMRSPKWSKPWTVAGLCGMLMGLSPSLLLIWLEPHFWMVVVARVGLALTLIGFAPGFLRNVWVVAHEFRHFRRGMVEQFDHDVEQFSGLVHRLAAHPLAVLERQTRYAKMGYERMGNRLIMMLGGIERLGILPLLLSLLVILRSWRDLLALPPWLGLLAFMAAVLWGIGWGAAEFRRRLQLYAFLLDEAVILHRARLREKRDGGS